MILFVTIPKGVGILNIRISVRSMVENLLHLWPDMRLRRVKWKSSAVQGLKPKRPGIAGMREVFELIREFRFVSQLPTGEQFHAVHSRGWKL